MSFSPLKPTSPPDEDVRAFENEASGVKRRSTLATVLGASKAVVQVSTTGSVDAEASKDVSGVMTGAVGRSGVIFVPKVAQGKSSMLSRVGVEFAKAVAYYGVGGQGS
jgi:hypothetical protein